MPITVNLTDTFEQWRVKTNLIGSGLESNVGNLNALVTVSRSNAVVAINETQSSANVTGGKLNNVTIGATTANTGAFTALTAANLAATGNITVGTGAATSNLHVFGTGNITGNASVGGNLSVGVRFTVLNANVSGNVVTTGLTATGDASLGNLGVTSNVTTGNLLVTQTSQFNSNMNVVSGATLLVNGTANIINWPLGNLSVTGNVITTGLLRVGTTANVVGQFTAQANSRFVGNVVMTAGTGSNPKTLDTGNAAVTGMRVATFWAQALISTTSGAITVDWTQAQFQKQLDPTGTITYTFTNPPGPCHLQLLVGPMSTAQTFMFSTTVTWIGATWVPVANKTSILNFWFDGSSYFGMGTNEV